MTVSKPLFSAAWYRVAPLRPRLAAHARVHRHVYRGRTWFVLQNVITGRFHRFDTAAYTVISLFDGRQSVDDIWLEAGERLGDRAPTQDEVIQLLSQLHTAEVLLTGASSDTEEIFQRHQKTRKRKLLQRALSPLALQISLLDPDLFLSRTEPYLRPLMTRWAAIAAVFFISPALLLVAIHAEELFGSIVDQLFGLESLAILWLTFPVVKALHELGHAYVTKRYGGEVHDIGIMFLVLTPVPYVDASAASAFRERRHRVAVGAAGMGVEILLAAAAVYLWVSVEAGFVRALAFNVIVISGVTTLLFNINPLLRFDGYYIFADWLEIPNLRQRSNRYFRYLFEHYALKLPDAIRPQADRRERAWLVGYSVLAFLYRFVVIASIAMFVLDWSLIAGVLMLGISSITWVVIPFGKALSFLFKNARLEAARGRVIGIVGGLVVAVLLALVVLPAPLRTRSEAVVWLPDEAYVRASVDGFVTEVVAQPGSRVEVGDLLIACSDPQSLADLEVLVATEREIEARYIQQAADDAARAQVILERLNYARDAVARGREKIADLSIRSKVAGTFVAPDARNLIGRFVRQGEDLATVVELDRIFLRAIVTQDDIELVRSRLVGVKVRLSENVGEVLHADLRRMVPAASYDLPSTALANMGGGEAVLDPSDPSGAKTLTSFFELELELPSELGLVNVGGRAFLRFDLGSEPIAFQVARRLRQLFLTRLSV